MAQSSVDADPLPGNATSWAPGESTAGQPNAAAGTGGAATAVDTATKDIADLQRQKVETGDQLSAGLVKTLDADSARLKHAYDQEGAALNDPALRPWNEAAEQAKHETDPIQAFGSLGSVFGILASAFTHAPMENALNASAAAINAIKQGNRQGYEDARKAWEGNYKLVLERQKIQHEMYQDAASLMQTNLAAGEAKMRVLAARFDDRKTLALLDNGMSKEVIDLMAAREQLAGKMTENQVKMMEANAEMGSLLSKGYNPAKPASPESQKAYKEYQEEKARLKRESSPYYGRTTSATTQADFVQRRLQEIRDIEGREPSTDDLLKAQEDWTRASTKGLDVRQREADERSRHNKAVEDIQTRRGDNSEAITRERERHDKAMEEIQKTNRGGATSLTRDRQIAADVNEMVEAAKKAHPDWGAQEIADYRAKQFKRLNGEAASPSGNRIDDIKGKVGQVEMAESIIGHVEDMLKKHNAITGLGGKVTRPAEIVGNVFGGNETDRKQFERWVSELQEIAPRILLDSKGRPLAAEAERVSTIIAGLKLGDTTANTARAYYELRQLLTGIKNRLRERAGTGDDAPAALAPQKRPSWKDAPVVQP